MVDFGESDKMIKISGKVDNSNTYNGFCANILSFIWKNFFRLNKQFLSCFFFCILTIWGNKKFEENAKM